MKRYKPGLCKVDDCTESHRSQGMCAYHWFDSRVERTETCWIWTGGRNDKNYGVTGYQNRKIGAHRWSYMLHKGPIPDGMYVCHTCDNPPCVNPEHLFLGTHVDNMADAAQKGRFTRRKGPHPDKTHCIHGHEYTPENTVIRHYRENPRRVCRTCHGPAIPPADRKCVVCNELIPRTRRVSSVACSPECSTVWRRIRRRKEYAA